MMKEIFPEIENVLGKENFLLTPVLNKIFSNGAVSKIPSLYQWLDYEINGYPPNEEFIPQYRRFTPELYGTYQTSEGIEERKIEAAELPEELRRQLEHLPIFQSLSSLEYAAQADAPKIYFSLPEKKFRKLKEYLEFRGHYCTSAWSCLDKEKISFIIASVRELLKNFLSELQALSDTHDEEKFSVEADRIFRGLLRPVK